MKHTKALWGILFVSMFAVSVSGTAFAEEMADGEAPADDGKGIYGGFQAGGSLWDEGDDSSFGWRANVWAHPFAYLGVEQLANFVSLEVAFVDLGKITPGSDSTLGNGGQADAGEVRTSVDGWEFSIVPTLPLPVGPGIALFGKAGIFLWDADIRSATDSGESDQDLVYGAGAMMDLPMNFGARVEWTRHRLNFDVGNEDVDLITGGFYYRFR